MDDNFFSESHSCFWAFCHSRYLKWPFYLLSALALVTNRLRISHFAKSILLPTWWAMIVTGAALVLSFSLAWIVMPGDQASRLVFFTFFLSSLPILMPCLAALFLKPE